MVVLQRETALKCSYDTINREWRKSQVWVTISPTPFQRGTLRLVHKGSQIDKNGEKHDVVFKFFCQESLSRLNVGPITRKMYEDDVTIQATAQYFAKQFNQKEPPKRVAILDCWLLELVERPGMPLCLVEPQLNGTYTKYNDNWGGVFDDRNTPQAFSHFTLEDSKRQLLVCDIQGVGDMYTDPRIHSRSGQEFGIGDKGIEGMRRFVQSHVCNPICQKLRLPVAGLGQRPAETILPASGSAAPITVGGSMLSTNSWRVPDRNSQLDAYSQNSSSSLLSTSLPSKLPSSLDTRSLLSVLDHGKSGGIAALGAKLDQLHHQHNYSYSHHLHAHPHKNDSFSLNNNDTNNNTTTSNDNNNKNVSSYAQNNGSSSSSNNNNINNNNNSIKRSSNGDAGLTTTTSTSSSLPSEMFLDRLSLALSEFEGALQDARAAIQSPANRDKISTLSTANNNDNNNNNTTTTTTTTLSNGRQSPSMLSLSAAFNSNNSQKSSGAVLTTSAISHGTTFFKLLPSTRRVPSPSLTTTSSALMNGGGSISPRTAASSPAATPSSPTSAYSWDAFASAFQPVRQEPLKG